MTERSLELQDSYATVAIRSLGDRPFVFRKMVAGAMHNARPANGDIVRVVDRDELHIGYGLWNSQSKIAIRILTHSADPPGPEFWSETIGRAITLRRDALALDQQSNAYRVIHAEGDGLSGLIVDRYDDVLSAEIFSVGMYQRIGPILRMMGERLGSRHHRVHVDDRIAEAERFPGRPIASPDLPARVAIQEHGVRYRVRFDGGHKTGFFCDQRENRQALAAFCRDQDVLDACCYTGGFGINALVRGGAKEATCVDLDEKAIAQARDNANLNQVRPNLVHADAFGYMRQMISNGREYGVVVLDPPKLILNRDEIAQGKRKYFDLNSLALGLVAPGGLLLSCSCSGLLPNEEFLHLLGAAARRCGREVQLLALTGAGADHPVRLNALEGLYLKAAWLRVGERATSPARDSADSPPTEST